MSRLLMVQGTHSSAGKSILATAFCRIFAQDGWRVAPFKAQNMSLNAGVTSEGGEMGRAQIVQAEAAGIPPHTDMNPVLLKPEGHRVSQVILNGRARGGMDAKNFYTLKDEVWPEVTAAFDRLRSDYDIVVMEGAGSPAEINLKAGDITNMRIALYGNAPVLLAGDIDRGGVFAALVGTMVLLEPDERAMVRGFLVNKFRGDISLLGDGLQMLQEAAFGVPTLGVIPYLANLGIAEEDAAPLEYLRDPDHPEGGEMVRVAIVRLPRMSNFDEFDALRREPGVSTRFADVPADLEGVDAVILPGSKMTIPDLNWLSDNGWTARLHQLAAAGGAVVGLCGGYQLLGEELIDPYGVESAPGTQMAGLGLLPVRTIFEPEKVTELTAAQVIAGQGWLKAVAGSTVRGYQIHTGRSEMTGACEPLLELSDGPDGAVVPGGRVWGCYLHGIFENDMFRHAWLRSLGWHGEGIAFDREAAYDRLADHVRAHVDLERIYAIMDEHSRP